MQNELHFKPWIGKDYEKNGRVLLLGESHYRKDGTANPEFTKDIINEFINNKQDDIHSQNGYRLFANTGLLFSNDCYEIWNRVAFSNVIQRSFANRSAQPTTNDINSIESNFRLILKELSPSKIIVLSRRLWNWIPTDTKDPFTSLKENEKHSNVWEYSLPNGGKSLAIGICHPSRMYGRNGLPDAWSPLVKKFIQMS